MISRFKKIHSLYFTLLQPQRLYAKNIINFSTRIEKFRELKEGLQLEINDENKRKFDLKGYETSRESEGWRIKQEGMLVELSKKIEEYQVRMLNNIRSPCSFEDDDSIDVGMSEITICITKQGSDKTMSILITPAYAFRIISITFHENYNEAKQHRLNFKPNHYSGPYIQTIPKEIHQAINEMIKNLGCNDEFILNFSTYCFQSEHGVYLEWLNDLKEVL